MDTKTFWNLGWNDLLMWLDKLHYDRKKRNEDRELHMEMTRQMMCLIYNVNRGTNPARDPQFFMKLSYDQQDNTKEKPTDEELTERLERLKKLFPDGK